ncbi:MAG TPA: hypothetical protein VJ810_14480 [Blastocatellia bacterium]|nr:hypothetical protein [Blastocatellia bacterium]
MNCQDFEKLALDLACNRLLDATTREDGLIHTEGCERCAARLAEERALLARMRAVVAELAAEEPPERVDIALLAAFRAQTAAPAISSLIPTLIRERRWSNWKLAAVAAGILILISMMAIFWRSASSFKPQREERAVAPTPASSPQAKPPNPAGPQFDRDQIVVEKKLPKRAPRRAPVDNSGETEVVTRFFPLREGEDLTALESLQLVRIELPGSALSEVGLPVNPEIANAPVVADVVLGQDGLARAIRFVR